MIDCINVQLTAEGVDEIERTVEFLSRLCAEAYVKLTTPDTPFWCTVHVCLGETDYDGPYEIGSALVKVPRRHAPLLCGLIDHVLNAPDWWAYGELGELGEAYEQMEEADEEARMQDEFRHLSYENDYIPSLYA